MKVGELIELLKDVDPEKEIAFTYNSGDYWRSVLVAPVVSVEEGRARVSDYHGGRYKLVDEDYERERENAEPEPSVPFILLEGSTW